MATRPDTQTLVLSSSFANQGMAQIELWTKPGGYKNEAYALPQAP